jgi:hypothetical protein
MPCGCGKRAIVRSLSQRLAESGYGRSEACYRVAQAISECLPIESKEKKQLDGLLARRARLQKHSSTGLILCYWATRGYYDAPT